MKGKVFQNLLRAGLNDLASLGDARVVRQESYDGIVEENYGKEARVILFDKDDTEYEEVFPIALFTEGSVPQEGDAIKFHLCQLDTDEYRGYFTVLEQTPIDLSPEGQKEVQQVLEKWRRENPDLEKG